MTHYHQDTIIDGRLWLSAPDHSVHDDRHIRLLEEIAATRSVSEAARRLGLPDQSAWDAVESMNRLTEAPLVVSHTNGRQEQETRLTSHGLALVRLFRDLEAEHRRLLSALEWRLLQLASGNAGAGALPLVRTTTDNQLLGCIAAIHRGSILSEVVLTIKEQGPLLALVTNACLDHLMLMPGDSAYALFTAHSVIPAKAASHAGSWVHNRLGGTLMALRQDEQLSELSVRLSGDQCVRIVDATVALAPMNLAVGDPLELIVKSTDVWIGPA